MSIPQRLSKQKQAKLKRHSLQRSNVQISKNADGTWTSGPNTKIGTNDFSNHTFDSHGVSIGGAYKRLLFGAGTEARMPAIIDKAEQWPNLP